MHQVKNTENENVHFCNILHKKCGMTIGTVQDDIHLLLLSSSAPALLFSAKISKFNFLKVLIQKQKE